MANNQSILAVGREELELRRSSHLASGPSPGPGSRPSSQGSSPGVSCTLDKLPHVCPASAGGLLHMHKHKNPPLAHKDFLHVCKLETVASGQFVEKLSDFLSNWGGGQDSRRYSNIARPEKRIPERSRKVWKSLGKSRKVWKVRKNKSRKVWKSLEKSGKSGKVWTNLGQSGKVWTFLDFSSIVFVLLSINSRGER